MQANKNIQTQTNNEPSLNQSRNQRKIISAIFLDADTHLQDSATSQCLDAGVIRAL